MDLSAEEVRVLGCLVEKQLTTPAQYPLTENAVVAAANQSTNRDPVVSYDQATVRRALLSLRQHGLAKMVHRPGDRVEKHRHRLDEALELSPPEVAVLCVLLLRGVQTAGELRARTERLHRFATVSDVDDVLSALAEREPEPLVERLGRPPGHSQPRFRHLLGVAEPADGAVDVPRPADATSPVDSLRAEVAQLRARVEQLEARLRARSV